MRDSEFAALWTALTSAYPNFKTPAATIEVYNRALADLDYRIAEAAVLECVSTRTFFPTIAEIRESAARLALGRMAALPALEAWGMVKRAVGIFGRDNWAGASQYLDETTAKAIYALGWRSFCDSDTDEEMSWRARFVDLYAEYQRRELEQARMLPAVREVAQAQLEALAAMEELTRRLTAPTVKHD